MHREDGNLEGDSADLFERGQLRNYFVFAVGSVRRRKWLVAVVLTSIVASTVLALWALPETYHVEAKLLAQRNQVLAVRGDGPDAVAPTRGAAESVQRRDNLVALIRATDLVNHARDHRSPSQQMMASVTGLFRAEETEQDRIDAMVEVLEKRLVAWTSDSTVSIAIDWPDAEMACRIVDAAQKNFLELRYAQEITALAESISIVQSHAVRLSSDIDDAVAGVARLRADKQVPKTNAVAATAAPVARTARSPEARPELAELKLTLDAKQRVIDDLEAGRRHRLSELQARLVEQRATYTENHPVIVDLRQTIAAMSIQSPQVKGLSQEVAQLRAEFEQKSAEATSESSSSSGVTPAAYAPPSHLPSEIPRLDQDLREDRDPGAVYARGRLRDAMDKYSALRAQVQAAQIDLETAQAAFKYRYSVLTPAQLPKRPASPNVPLVLMAAFIAAVFAAVFAAVLADVRAGRLVERWQIEKLLERPILGEMHLPPLPGHDS